MVLSFNRARHLRDISKMTTILSCAQSKVYVHIQRGNRHCTSAHGKRTCTLNKTSALHQCKKESEETTCTLGSRRF